MTDTPALSNIAYDELVVGDKKGPYTETVSADLAAQLAGPIGKRTPVSQAPPATYPVLFLRALRRGMGGIPAGSILAKQELDFHASLPVDSDVHITTWVGSKEVKRERPFVTIEFDIRDDDDKQIVSGRKIIVWPTGPGESSEFPTVIDLVTQDGIDAYAELSGDFNPLHVDPEAAAASEFGGIIAHGPIALHAFFRAATEWLGVDALPPASQVRVTYRAPTRPGDEVRCELRERKELPDGRVAVEADCVKQDGTTVVSIRAVL